MKRSLQSTLLLLLFIVVLLLAPVLLPEFYVTLLNYIGLYAIVALGLVMLTGVGGLTSFGQAAFVGLGAYTSAYLTTVHGVSPWLTLPAGLLVTGVVANMYEANPDLTPQQVKDILRSTAQPLPGLAPHQQGAGVFQPAAAVEAARALRKPSLEPRS